MITSYPRKWIERYVEEQYLNVDPVFRQARRPGPAFLWDFRDPKMARSMKERRFFDDALSADIRIGVTVPITAGFGRFAMFSLAADEPNAALERLADDAKDLLQVMAVAYHAHAEARVAHGLSRDHGSVSLTQRERQCLAWASCGKTREETAIILGVTSRAVRFHLDNARQNLGASTITHAVALAMRQGLLP